MAAYMESSPRTAWHDWDGNMEIRIANDTVYTDLWNPHQRALKIDPQGIPISTLANLQDFNVARTFPWTTNGHPRPGNYEIIWGTAKCASRLARELLTVQQQNNQLRASSASYAQADETNRRAHEQAMTLANQQNQDVLHQLQQQLDATSVETRKNRETTTQNQQKLNELGEEIRRLKATLVERQATNSSLEQTIKDVTTMIDDVRNTIPALQKQLVERATAHEQEKQAERSNAFQFEELRRLILSMQDHSRRASVSSVNSYTSD